MFDFDGVAKDERASLAAKVYECIAGKLAEVIQVALDDRDPLHRRSAVALAMFLAAGNPAFAAHGGTASTNCAAPAPLSEIDAALDRASSRILSRQPPRIVAVRSSSTLGSGRAARSGYRAGLSRN